MIMVVIEARFTKEHIMLNAVELSDLMCAFFA